MTAKTLLFAAAGLLPLAAIGGCEGHHHHEEPGPVVSVEPAPDGYVYYSDPYYYQGHYDRDYWYWNDRDGRAHREMRDEHERRVREHPQYEGERYDRNREGERGREGDREQR